MFNTNVIPVYTTSTGEKIVIGRELHSKFRIDTDYPKWADRMCDYGFKSNSKRLDNIGDIIALNPNSWRKEAQHLIFKIAQNLGGNEYIKTVQNEVYQLIDQRGGKSLETRLTNKRRRMADEGICKSKQDKLNKLDVIADDKVLFELYVAIVKEMAIKYGINIEPKQKA